MASRIVHSTRASLRAGGSRLAHASRSSFQLRAHAAHRGMASDAQAHETKSDTPWIIGSALLFGPALVYLLGPGRSNVTGHGDPHADPHVAKHGAAPAPVKQKVHPVDQAGGKKEGTENQAGEQEEGTEDGSGQKDTSSDDGEAKDEIDQGVKSDAPKAAKAAEEQKDTPPSKEKGGDDKEEKGQEKGDEESEKPGEGEIKEAVQQGVKSDAPKTAKTEEEKQKS